MYTKFAFKVPPRYPAEVVCVAHPRKRLTNADLCHFVYLNFNSPRIRNLLHLFSSTHSTRSPCQSDSRSWKWSEISLARTFSPSTLKPLQISEIKWGLHYSTSSEGSLPSKFRSTSCSRSRTNPWIRPEWSSMARRTTTLRTRWVDGSLETRKRPLPHPEKRRISRQHFEITSCGSSEVRHINCTCSELVLVRVRSGKQRNSLANASGDNFKFGWTKAVTTFGSMGRSCYYLVFR